MNETVRQRAIRSVTTGGGAGRSWRGSVYRPAGRRLLHISLRTESGRWISRPTGMTDTPENREIARAVIEEIRARGPILGPPPKKPKAKPRSRSNGRNKSFKRRRGEACEVCGWLPRPPLRETACNAHHVRPRAEGGDESDENRVVLCPNHHAVAHALHRVEPAQDRAGLLARIRAWEAGPVVTSAA